MKHPEQRYADNSDLDPDFTELAQNKSPIHARHALHQRFGYRPKFPFLRLRTVTPTDLINSGVPCLQPPENHLSTPLLVIT
jgi:hypothetical protein